MLKPTLLKHFIKELSALILWRHGDTCDRLSKLPESGGIENDHLDAKMDGSV